MFHQRNPDFVTVDHSVTTSEGGERGDYDFVIIGGSTLLSLTEHIDELCEVDVGGAVGDHLVDLLVGEGDADVVSRRSDVPATNYAVLITVHELEPFLEFGYLSL